MHRLVGPSVALLLGLGLLSNTSEAALITSFPGTGGFVDQGFRSDTFTSDGIDDHYDIVMSNFFDNVISATLGASLTIGVNGLFAGETFLTLTWDEGPYNLAPSGEDQFELDIGGFSLTSAATILYTVVVDSFSATGVLPTSGTLAVPFSDFAGATPSDFTAVNFLSFQLSSTGGGILEITFDDFPTSTANATAIPEPSSMLLCALGIAGLFCRRRTG